MALNPIAYSEKVVRSFLRYQLTAYPFADERLLAQMRTLLSLDETRSSPLLKGPYVSLSRPFRQGVAVDDLVREKVFHPHMRQRIPAAITHVYGHQEEAIRAIRSGRTTLVSTGTGSGKSECFLYPIVSKCLEMRDAAAPSGICAVIVYPMNALAEDQLQRLRGLLAGTGIPFGMYVGKTPEFERDVAGIRLPAGASRADYEATLERVRREKRSETVFPPEEVCSREIMRTPGKQPRILLTNVKQLELLLTRQRDVELFAGARLDFLVFDEAHTFTGAQGAETACLIRRLRSFCGRGLQDTVCVATSATIVDRNDPDAARKFASRFFGVPAGDVVTVGEAYEAATWATPRRLPAAPGKEASSCLGACVTAVEDDAGDGKALRAAYRDLAGEALAAGDWKERLHDALSHNELLFRMSELLVSPRPLAELALELSKAVGRAVSEAELLAWLTLGAAARRDGRPLVRPVVHGFIRGISGAVVSFPRASAGPRLWLAAEDEVEAEAGGEKHAHFPVTTCSTCGQHYFVALLESFEFTGKRPGGGRADGNSTFWEPLEQAKGGRRALFVDRIVGEGDDDDLEDHRRMALLHLCRHCGTAHAEAGPRCLHCGLVGPLVALHAIRQSEDHPGLLTSCVSCGTNLRRLGTRWREPARPVRATNVADVHVLAQDMVQHAERRRLLVFCDNRQDAAFQAGWMKDHARRFRLRALMAEGIASGALSVGDLALRVDQALDRDEALSRALIPEVWQVARKEGSGGEHERERRKFLRIQVLREVTLSSRQSLGLEPWGRMKVEYDGLHAGLPWIVEHSRRFGLPPDELRDGVANLLDYLRRTRVLHDAEHHVFSKFWGEGDLEIQQGYLPQAGAPKGTKLSRDGHDRPEWVAQWLSERGDTTFRQIARKWGVETEDIPGVLESLFKMLCETEFLKPVVLTGEKGRALPNVSGVYQVDADVLRLHANHGVWRCRTCRRRSPRRTPHGRCPAWRCDGQLEYLQEDPDNYDLQLLDEGYVMLRPEEHTAMVPHDERERLENLFKGDSDAVNAFVCTPTLELGVDIGQLDSVLMRNVPPLPANYWQRAGRAGRRHRMAVNLTYCRPVSHDRAYFTDPLKLLSGRVDPPAFNLRNEQMVAKHVHATMITRLHQYARDPARAEPTRATIGDTLSASLPKQVSSYLFDGGRVRTAPFDFATLERLIADNRDDLLAYVRQVFHQGWPDSDRLVIEDAAIAGYVDGFVGGLQEVERRLAARLHWALRQIERLNQDRAKQGTLEPEDDALFRRCDQIIKKLKGATRRQRSEAEGYEDTNTFGVLAAEGFLPGYGLEVGSILGTADIPFWRTGAMEFALPRPPSVALREYVPGNLIYANGHRFVARRFHRDVDRERNEEPTYEVSAERQAVKPTPVGAAASTLGSTALTAISVCDVDLVHQSHISDEEELRFQMGVAIYGLERDQHNGGKEYRWGEQVLQHRRGVRLRLVNVGATATVENADRADRLGYPVCTVCGQSVSPLSSERQRLDFKTKHEERCGLKQDSVGFYADVVADVLSLPKCADATIAYSVLEALRIAATQVLDMDMEDLQLLVIGHVDREEVDTLLWDPMPGGSGLLDQILERFGEIVQAAHEVVEKCPAACATSCIDCLQTFRNSFYHSKLDRTVALDRLEAWGRTLQLDHEIPSPLPVGEARSGAHPVNECEQKLRHMLLAAGFPEGTRGEQILLDRAIGSTTPDVIYRSERDGDPVQISIYLDGLSGHLHGNAETRDRDQRIRGWLRSHDWEVLEITVVELDEPDAMTRHFRKLAGYLGDGGLKARVAADHDWFDRAQRGGEPTARRALRVVTPKAGERFVTCVPLIPLKAAAGGFGSPQALEELADEWVEIDAKRKLQPGMFVAQVVGKSMEPIIPDGAHCLFASQLAGTRQGKVVLVALRDAADPETNERFTVKRYESTKIAAEDGAWRHIEVMLKPANKSFKAITLTCDDEGQVRVVAEFVEVVA